MLIRSQDKKCIANLDNTARITIDKTKGDVYQINAGYCPIAEYSTEEKAIKVLDMIQKDYERRWGAFQMPQDREM